MSFDWLCGFRSSAPSASLDNFIFFNPFFPFPFSVSFLFSHFCLLILLGSFYLYDFYLDFCYAKKNPGLSRFFSFLEFSVIYWIRNNSPFLCYVKKKKKKKKKSTCVDTTA